MHFFTRSEVHKLQCVTFMNDVIVAFFLLIDAEAEALGDCFFPEFFTIFSNFVWRADISFLWLSKNFLAFFSRTDFSF
jgi:hypothetical protein